MVDSGTHTRSLTRATETKAAVLADAQSRAARLATEMSSLHGRSRELAQHLAEQTAAREARPIAVAPCTYPLANSSIFLEPSDLEVSLCEMVRAWSGHKCPLLAAF